MAWGYEGGEDLGTSKWWVFRYEANLQEIAVVAAKVCTRRGKTVGYMKMKPRMLAAAPNTCVFGLGTYENPNLKAQFDIFA